MLRDGVTFQVAPAQVADRATRMDVAAFVGFAASGPLHTPVVIEDPVQFDEIFGGRYILAWNRASGAPLQAHLRTAVYAFFANGGVRCWVVRVAEGAVANRFVVPGLMRLQGGSGGPRSALLQARSEGSWSDRFAVGSSLHRMPLGECLVRPVSATGVQVDLDRSLRERISEGDLLRITFGEKEKQKGLLLYAAIDEREGGETEADRRIARLLGRGFWFRRVEALPLTRHQVSVRTEDDHTVIGYWCPPSLGESVLYLPASRAPSVGAMLTVAVAPDDEIILSVLEVRQATAEERRNWPGQFEDVVVVTGADPLRRVDPLTLDLTFPVDGVAERLNFHLWVRDPGGRLIQLKDLGFTGRHPRFAGYLPTDTALYQAGDDGRLRPDGDLPGQSLWPSVTMPRFPLAAVEPNLEAQRDDVLLPIAMGVVEPHLFADALPRSEDPLERDGLITFSPRLFMDPDLADVPSEALEAEVFQKRYVRMQTLRGLHGLWPLSEVTLVALPDAGHGGWSREAAEPLTQAPALTGSFEAGGSYRLRWSSLGEGVSYRLQSAPDPDFTADVTEVAVTGQEHVPLPTRHGSREYFFRVQGESGMQRGPWSNTESAVLPRPTFAPRHARIVPNLRVEPEGGGMYLFSWPNLTADRYVLQTSHDPNFENPLTVYAGAKTSEAVWHSGSSLAYYRLRAQWGADRSPWSNTIVITPDGGQSRWEVVEPEGQQADALRADLTALHTALLRMAAARGDLFAVLSLPNYYRDSEVSYYSRSLATDLRSEEAILSYGSLYHPWLWVDPGMGGDGPVLAPPDGVVAGQFAARALGEGVWFPAANRVMTSVTDVFDPVEPEAHELLLRERVNVIQREARGVLVMSASTLSRDPAFGSSAVRRLFCLLRRLIVDEGSLLAFEPNTESFREAAVVRFRRLLSDLFLKGAFAGETPDDSFALLVNPSLNTRNAMDEGRFILDLQVAPSRPLAFLTVRLMQAQGGGLTVREV